MVDFEIDSIYDYFDYLLRHERFAFIDRILKNIDIDECDEDELLSYLTVTYPIKSKLKCRKGFYDEVEKLLGEGLLKGLK